MPSKPKNSRALSPRFYLSSLHRFCILARENLSSKSRHPSIATLHLSHRDDDEEIRPPRSLRGSCFRHRGLCFIVFLLLHSASGCDGSEEPRELDIGEFVFCGQICAEI